MIKTHGVEEHAVTECENPRKCAIHSFLFQEWCMTLHGNHHEHQCRKKPGHAWASERDDTVKDDRRHECYCGVWW